MSWRTPRRSPSLRAPWIRMHTAWQGWGDSDRWMPTVRNERMHRMNGQMQGSETDRHVHTTSVAAKWTVGRCSHARASD
eukprot:2326912-Rhodomonas_salina.1